MLSAVLIVRLAVDIGIGREQISAAYKTQAFTSSIALAIAVFITCTPGTLSQIVGFIITSTAIRMLKENNLVRKKHAVELAGYITTVCTNKTGTLTQNRMTVVVGTVGTHTLFDHVPTGTATADGEDRDEVRKFDLTSLSASCTQLLFQSIAINSTAFESEECGLREFIGSKTECALLNFARDHLHLGDLTAERWNADVVAVYPFNSTEKCMGTVIRLESGTHRLLVKGAADILVPKCESIINDPSYPDIGDTTMSVGTTEFLLHRIQEMASRSLHPICLVYKDFQSWPPAGTPGFGHAVDDLRVCLHEMTFLGLFGIQDPLRAGVNDAVRECQNAGVYVRMVTADNLFTAKAIAQECGIYTPGGIVMEGPHFRKLSVTQMNEIIPRLQVLARSSPEDKRILVRRLKQLGETVATCGKSYNDSIALRTADVGFSLGIVGTEVAKDASSITIMDDNFSSILRAIMWGRLIHQCPKKLIQVR